MLIAPVRHLLLAHHGHVVLGQAGDHAGLAAGAAVEVHRHAPAVVGILHRRVHARVAGVLGRLAPQLQLARGGQPTCCAISRSSWSKVACGTASGRRPPLLARVTFTRGTADRPRPRPARAPRSTSGLAPAFRSAWLGCRSRHCPAGVGAGIGVALPHRHRHRLGMERLHRIRGQLDAPCGEVSLTRSPRATPMLGGLGGNLHPAVPRHLGHGIRALPGATAIGAAAVVEAARGIHEQRVRAAALELRRRRLDAPGLRPQRDRRRRRLAPYAAAPQSTPPRTRRTAWPLPSPWRPPATPP